MTEQELRALVRDAIARQAMHGPAAHGHVPAAHAAGATQASPAHPRLHPSHGLFMLPAGSDSDGPCLIEPSVMCNHCGYCQSYGH
jgi:hypothetical protein